MNRSDKFSEVREIADAICMNQATTEQLQQLERLLSGNFDAQHFYYDYISMHMHLNSAVERNMEFVYRRMTEITSVTEEFVVRPKDANIQSEKTIDDSSESPRNVDVSSSLNTGDGMPPSGNFINNTQEFSSDKRPLAISKYKNWLMIGLLIIALVLITWLFVNKTSTPFIAEITQGHATIHEQGKIDGNYLFPGQYKVSQDSVLKFDSGDIVYLTNQSIFKIFNNRLERILRI